MCPLQPKMIHTKFFEFWFNSLTKEEYRKIPFPASSHVDFSTNSFYFPFKHLKDLILLCTKGLSKVITMAHILLCK